MVVVEGEEFIHVTEGAVEVTVKGRTILLREGDSLNFTGSVDDDGRVSVAGRAGDLIITGGIFHPFEASSAALADSSAPAALAWVTLSIWDTAVLTCSTPWACSVEAWVIWAMRSATFLDASAICPMTEDGARDMLHGVAEQVDEGAEVLLGKLALPLEDLLRREAFGELPAFGLQGLHEAGIGAGHLGDGAQQQR